MKSTYTGTLAAFAVSLLLAGCGTLPLPALRPMPTVPVQAYDGLSKQIRECRRLINGRLTDVYFAVTRYDDRTTPSLQAGYPPKDLRDIVEATLYELGLNVLMLPAMRDDGRVLPAGDRALIQLRGGLQGFDPITAGATRRRDFSILPGRGTGAADLSYEHSAELLQGEGTATLNAWLNPATVKVKGIRAPGAMTWSSSVHYLVRRSQHVTGYTASLALGGVSAGARQVTSQVDGVHNASIVATRAAVATIAARAAAVDPARCGL